MFRISSSMLTSALYLYLYLYRYPSVIPPSRSCPSLHDSELTSTFYVGIAISSCPPPLVS